MTWEEEKRRDVLGEVERKSEDIQVSAQVRTFGLDWDDQRGFWRSRYSCHETE